MKNFIKKPRTNKTLTVLILFFFLGINLIEAQVVESRSDRLRKLYFENIRTNPLNKNRVWLMAHRGLWDEKSPESSVEAFAKAVKLKFEIVELDVVFSDSYTYEEKNGVFQCIPIIDPITKVKRSTTEKIHRAIIFTHDANNDRQRGEGNEVGFGLYRYADKLKGRNTPVNIGQNTYGMVMLQKLVPYNQTNANVIMCQNEGNGGKVDDNSAPILLALDGNDTKNRLITYNPAVPIKISGNRKAESDDPFNKQMVAFVNTVKDKVLINIDKLKRDEDFAAVVKLMREAGLLEQCIFKTKGVESLENIYSLFKQELLLTDRVLFTPTFTEFDMDISRNKTGQPLDRNGEVIPKNSNISPICIEESARLTEMIKRWNNINLPDGDNLKIARVTLDKNKQINNSIYVQVRKIVTPSVKQQYSYQKTPIAIAGAEVIFTKDGTEVNKTNSFLTELAKIIFNQGKRVVQFGALPESKKGAWTGGQAKWVGEGKYSKSNFWEFIYDNSSLNNGGTSTFYADVYVGDRPIEFKGYLNSMGYNMKPIE